jgi:hypothetical protein
MTKYEVEITAATYNVEADSEEEAIQEALDCHELDGVNVIEVESFEEEDDEEDENELEREDDEEEDEA